MFRVKGLSWWKEELPTEEEMENGRKNLEKNQYKVDFILTHSPSASVVALLGRGLYEQGHSNKISGRNKTEHRIQKMVHGTYAPDYAMNDKDILLYEQIVRIN